MHAQDQPPIGTHTDSTGRPLTPEQGLALQAFTQEAPSDTLEAECCEILRLSRAAELMSMEQLLDELEAR